MSTATYDPILKNAAVEDATAAQIARHPDLAGLRVHTTRTVRFAGVFEAVARQVAMSLPTGRTKKGGVTLDVTQGRYMATYSAKPATPKQDATRALNWTYLQIAGAIGNLEVQLSRGVRLPDPRDDADFREAVRLLRGIDARRRQRKEVSRG